MPTEAAQAEFDKLMADTQISDRHPEDIRNSENRSEENQSSSRIRNTQRDPDSDYEDEGPARNFSTTISGTNSRSRYYIPSIRSEANTGPKGVIADAQAFEDAKRAAKHASIFQRGRNALAAATRRASRSPSSTQQQLTARPYDGNRSSVSAGEDASDLDDDEDDFMAQWRQGRLRELQDTYDGDEAQARADRRRPSPSANRRIWGSLVTVNAEGYLDAIEKVARDVVVVVLIYDDMSEVSQQVEACVRKLAWQHQTTRFVKLHYEEAEMEIAGVPAILAYRGGDKFAGLIPVIDEIPETDELSAESVGVALKRHRIL